MSKLNSLITLLFIFFNQQLIYGQRQIAIDSTLLANSYETTVSVKGMGKFPKIKIGETKIISVLKSSSKLKDIKTHNGLLKNDIISEKTQEVFFILISGNDTIYATAVVIEKELLQSQSALGDRIFGHENFGSFQSSLLCLEISLRDNRDSILGIFDLSNESEKKPALYNGEKNYSFNNLYGYVNAPKRLDKVYSGISVQVDSTVVAQLQHTLGKKAWFSKKLSLPEIQMISSVLCILLSCYES